MPRVASALVLTALTVAACGGGDRTEAGAQPIDPEVSQDLGTTAAKKTGLKLVKVGSFDAPVFVTAPPADRGRQFVVEQAGRIRVIRNGKKLSKPFLDIRRLVTSGGEQGLLSMAFAPDYATSKRFYVYYTDKDADQRVVQYTAASADRADAGSAKLVLRMADPEGNHNGGSLVFGPDGHLYIGTGDGGGAGDLHGRFGNGQDKTSLLGKILRITPKAGGGYTTPASNPFKGSGGRPAIYAYGLRNPWRFSFDRRTGAMTIGDVGQDEIEEINFVRKGKGLGANFGWRAFEGNDRYKSGESAPGHVKPVITHTHSNGWLSITGGVVVRDRGVPGAYGKYVYGDFVKGELFSAKLDTPKAKRVRNTGLKVDALSSFGEDARGRVYAVSLNGAVYRLAAK